MNDFLEAIDLLRGLYNKIQSRRGFERTEMIAGLSVLLTAMQNHLEHLMADVDFDQYEQCRCDMDNLLDDCLKEFNI